MDYKSNLERSFRLPRMTTTVTADREAVKAESLVSPVARTP